MHSEQDESTFPCGSDPRGGSSTVHLRFKTTRILRSCIHAIDEINVDQSKSALEGYAQLHGLPNHVPFVVSRPGAVKSYRFEANLETCLGLPRILNNGYIILRDPFVLWLLSRSHFRSSHISNSVSDDVHRARGPTAVDMGSSPPRSEGHECIC